MSILNFAVASIVEANTGHGLNRQYIDQLGSNYSTHEKQARVIRSRSFLDLVGKIKTFVQNYIEESKTEAITRQATKDLFQLNDRLLRDIGLTRYDLYDLHHGSTSLEALDTRHRLSFVKSEVAQPSTRVSSNVRSLESANQETFETKKCA